MSLDNWPQISVNSNFSVLSLDFTLDKIYEDSGIQNMTSSENIVDKKWSNELEIKQIDNLFHIKKALRLKFFQLSSIHSKTFFK